MAKKNLKKGIFITFEGPEGCGKSTHAKKTHAWLVKEGYDVFFTREPGGTFVGERIRDILLNPINSEISDVTEWLLFETARSQIVDELIKPALEQKKIVICDRFNDSTYVYQGYAGMIPIPKINAVDKIATKGLVPDLTILLDIDLKTGFERCQTEKPKDRMELKPLWYHKRVREGFIKRAAENKARIKVVAAKDSVDKTFACVKANIEDYLEKR